MIMKSYKQSIYNKAYMFLENELIKNSVYCSGERIETSTGVELISVESSIKNEYEGLDLLIPEFEKISRNYYNQYHRINTNFTAQLKMQQEEICIDGFIRDSRFYQYCRLIFNNGKNCFVDEFPIVGNSCKFLKKVQEKCNFYFPIAQESSGCSKPFKVQGIPIIFSPEASGYYAHEIIGHLLEEDMLDMINSKILKTVKIHPDLEIVDSINGVENFIGLSKYDDMGVIIQPITLIKDGVIKNIIAVNTEKSLDHQLYGMARRQSYKYPVLPRMRNTFIMPKGKKDGLELVKNYSRGFYILQIQIGNYLPSTLKYSLSGFGYFIKDGIFNSKICKFFYRGDITDDLMGISEIGNDFKIISSNCIKGIQAIRVCMGGTTICLNEGDICGEEYI